jgi:hypothetical protein
VTSLLERFLVERKEKENYGGIEALPASIKEGKTSSEEGVDT